MNYTIVDNFDLRTVGDVLDHFDEGFAKHGSHDQQTHGRKKGFEGYANYADKGDHVEFDLENPHGGKPTRVMVSKKLTPEETQAAETAVATAQSLESKYKYAHADTFKVGVFGQDSFMPERPANLSDTVAGVTYTKHKGRVTDTVDIMIQPNQVVKPATRRVGSLRGKDGDPKTEAVVTHEYGHTIMSRSNASHRLEGGPEYGNQARFVVGGRGGDGLHGKHEVRWATQRNKMIDGMDSHLDDVGLGSVGRGRAKAARESGWDYAPGTYAMSSVREFQAEAFAHVETGTPGRIFSQTGKEIQALGRGEMP